MCLSTWTPATPAGDLNGDPSSWLWPGPTQAVAGIWFMNHQMDHLSLSLWPSKNKTKTEKRKEKKKKKADQSPF